MSECEARAAPGQHPQGSVAEVGTAGCHWCGRVGVGRVRGQERGEEEGED